MHIGVAIVAGHVHGKPILAFAHLKPSMVMHSGKEASSEQLDQSLVRFTTPDKHSGADAIAAGLTDGNSMSHVFRRETEGAGDALRSKVLQSDQANAQDVVPTLLLDLQRRGQKALHNLRLRTEV
jgi:hypothetical protein